MIGKMLLGQDATLFSFTTGVQHVELAPSLAFGIPDVADISIAAGIIFDADLTAGYDTAGLIELAGDPQHNPADLLHGFFFDNSPLSNGATNGITPIRNTGLYLHGLMQLSGDLLGLTLTGGLYADISVELHSTDNSDHVHLDTLVSNLGSSRPVFKLGGKVYAQAEIDFSPLGVTLYSHTFGYDELLNFDPPGPPPPPPGVTQVVIDRTDTHAILLDSGKMVAGQTAMNQLGEPLPANVEPFYNVTLTSNGSTFSADESKSIIRRKSITTLK